MDLSEQYWNGQYTSKEIRWDIGYVSTPLKEYFDQIENKDIRILVPGAGSAWEAEYLYQLGFKNTYVLDFSEEAIAKFINRCSWFPKSNIIHQDFFKHNFTYDLIVEQTFFSSFHPLSRRDFVKQVCRLLNNRGKYMGLLFNHEFTFNGPPFGSNIHEYRQLFKPCFEFEVFEIATNSIKPRRGREIFMLLRKKITANF